MCILQFQYQIFIILWEMNVSIYNCGYQNCEPSPCIFVCLNSWKLTLNKKKKPLYCKTLAVQGGMSLFFWACFWIRGHGPGHPPPHKGTCGLSPRLSRGAQANICISGNFLKIMKTLWLSQNNQVKYTSLDRKEVFKSIDLFHWLNI